MALLAARNEVMEAGLPDDSFPLIERRQDARLAPWLARGGGLIRKARPADGRRAVVRGRAFPVCYYTHSLP